MSDQVTVRYWAGARRAAGRDSELISARTLGELLTELSQRAELESVLAASSFLVDGVAATPGTTLEPGQIVDVLPPFAGG
ncbi:MoaD/ThiS family protein [Jatrophihabitans telluris]|uniref:MoaD/ThiS family protein n=1 Tax=Jatrophihabitans telluris TaxID=2038343 RepID=A0ABY4R1P1_9ACTN|nr:MoaD/ThiS family protein [Jatrophihabitans telluris]UQX89232.1 MoaD/ThiS family protein [Jatrophihabitans telluris]